MAKLVKRGRKAKPQARRKALAPRLRGDAALEARLAEARAQQAATAEILGAIARSPANAQPVFDAIVESAMRLLRASTAHVTCLEGRSLHLVAFSKSDRAGAAALQRLYPVEVGGTFAAQALITRKPFVVADADQDPRVTDAVRATMRARRVRSFILMPLVSKAASIGTIVVNRKNAGPFSKEDVRLLTTFADQAVIAIENARLFNETKEALARQTATAEILKVIARSPSDVQPVFDAITRSGANLFSPSMAGIIMRHEDQLLLTSVAGYSSADLVALRRIYPVPFDTRKSFIAQVIAARKLLECADTEAPDAPEALKAVGRALGFRSLAVAPLMQGDVAIGALSISSPQVGSRMSEKQLAMLRTFADQAVIAIQNARLFNETKEALERQTATAEILKVIASSPSNVQPVFDAILGSAVNLCSAEIAAVFPYDGKLVHLGATYNWSEEALKYFFTVYPSPPSLALLSGRTILGKSIVQIADAAADPHYDPNSAATGHWRRMLGVPILREGQVFGALVVCWREPGETPQRQVDLLQTFADQAVIAIENVRLFKELEARNRDVSEALDRQRATADVLASISGSMTDTQPVFDAIVRNINRLFGTRFAVLQLLRDGIVEMPAVDGALGFEKLRDRYPRPLDETTVGGQAMLAKQAVQYAPVVGNPATPPATVEFAKDFGFDSVIFTPMIHEGKVIGAIGTALPEPKPFDERQIALIKTFADQAVIAIENARLFNETREALERQTATAEILRVISKSPGDVQPVLEAVASSAAQLCEAKDVIVLLREGDALRYRVHHGAIAPGAAPGETKTISRDWSAGRCAAEGRQLHIHDILAVPDEFPEGSRMGKRAGYRTVLMTPLLRDGVVLGVIGLRRAEVRPFESRQIELINTFADQAVIAIENVRLFNETREALEQQTATAEILRAISGSPNDIRPIFETLVGAAARFCGAPDVLIAPLDGDALRGGAACGKFADTVAQQLGSVQALRIAATRGTVAGRAVVDGRVIHVHDLAAESQEEYPDGRELQRRFGHRTMVAAPLLREGVPLGVIAMFRSEVKPFSDKQLALLQIFADQAVIAIENVRLFNETREALERQTATAEVLKVISRSPADVQPVFDAIARSAFQLLSGAVAGVLLRMGDGYSVAAVHTDRPSGALPPGPAYVPIDPAANFPSRVFVGKALLHIPDWTAIELPPHEKSVFERLGIRSSLMLPLMRGDECIGVLFVSRSIVHAYADREIALMQSFADQAAIAIENVRLFNETREALERQTATAEILKVIASSPSNVQPVLEAIVNSAARLVEPCNATIVMRDGNRLPRLAIAGPRAAGVDLQILDKEIPLALDIADSPTAMAILECRTIEIPDTGAADVTDRIRAYGRAGRMASFAIVPLIREGSGIGAIVLTTHHRGFKLNEKQLALMKTFADQAVIAIENVRLFNETKEALERQTATAEILKVISSSPTDIQPIFDAIVQSAVRLCNAVFAAGYRLEGGLIHLVAHHNLVGEGLAAVQRAFPMPADRDHLTARAIRESRIHHLQNMQSDPEVPATFRELAIANGYRTLLIVPMLRERRAIGAITVAKADGAFSEKQIALLTTFADQAVIAIENVRLFKELESRTEALTKSVGQLTALGEVGQAISSTLDLETVLQTIVSRAVQLTGVDAGAIYEYDEQGEVYRLQAAEKMAPELVEAVRRTPIRKGDGATGRTAVTLEPNQVPDIQDKSYRGSRKENLVRTGYRAVLAVPLLREGNLLGALQVFRGTPGTFEPEIVELLKTFATQSAMAIQNARLFREIADKGRQLEEASRHKSNFLASMSHELRTPLNAILGFNEMILGQVYGEVPADMQEPLGDIQTSGKHLLRLINNVLDLAKIEAGRMELSLQDYSVQDTVASVHSTLRPLAAEKGLEFLAVVPNDLPLAYGDGGRIAQCLMNLAGNSLKFTKAGKVEISVAEQGGRLTWRVADTGIGIAPEKIGTLFTEFRQTDATIASEYGGTGLGLSISRQFVEMHGGRIWVESEPGKGSAFIFEIPLRAGAA